MSTKWLVFLLSLWVILAALGAVIEAGFYGTAEETVLETLLSFRIFTTTEVAGIVPVPVPNMEWFGALLKVFTLDFAMFQDTSYGEMLHWMLFAPIGIAVALTFGLALMRGVGSS